MKTLPSADWNADVFTAGQNMTCAALTDAPRPTSNNGAGYSHHYNDRPRTIRSIDVRHILRSAASPTWNSLGWADRGLFLYDACARFFDGLKPNRQLARHQQTWSLKRALLSLRRRERYLEDEHGNPLMIVGTEVD